MNILRMNCWYLKQLPNNGCIVRNDRKQQYKLQAGGYLGADASSGLPFLDMKKITRESLKKAEKGSGVYTMGSVYKLPDTWTPTFDLSNHEKVSARNDYAEKPLKKVVEEIVERKNGDRMQRNMPYFVRLVVDYFYDRMRKTKNLQYGDRTQNHGQYKNPYTKI